MDELKVSVEGRVQGVGFRQFVKKTADDLGIKGFVMNRENGSVSIVAQSDKKNLGEFLDRVQKGPMLSKIEGLSYFWRKPLNKYDGFVISLDKGFIEDQKSSFFNLGRNLLKIKNQIPSHIAIIPDGNRRWAKENGLNSVDGHKEGGSMDRMKKLLDEAKNLGVKYLTFWLFSTENWGRDKTEVNYLFDLFIKISGPLKDYALKNKTRFMHLGRKDRLPKKVIEHLNDVEKATENFREFNVQFCLDYGGRDEIIRAINKIIKSGVKEVKENEFIGYLDTRGIPDPDMVIRTSGEKRTSGFMPFQAGYSELYFADCHFPDFGPEDLRKAVEEFGSRKRNFGK